MQWGLFLLILMGQCSLLTCESIEYHFVNENKNWDESRKYCKQKYTDLATVYDKTSLNRLMEEMGSQDAWIGLNNTGGTREWHWSQPGVEYNDGRMKQQWKRGEPDDVDGKENCVRMDEYGQSGGADITCSKSYRPICYDENKPSNEKYHVIEAKMNWTEAQQYCREHHTDLLSGHDQMDEFRDENKDRYMWIGLFRDTWNWSDGSRISFRNWDVQTYKNDQTNDASITKCAAVSHGSGKWSPADCDAKKPFVCHKGQCSNLTCESIEYHFVNENKTWDESRKYCRQNYTDLATVYNKTSLDRLMEKMGSQDAWIGLNNTGGTREWHWSQPGVEYNDGRMKWNGIEPNDVGGKENCVMMDEYGQSGGADITCSESYRPICYDENKPSNKKYHVIETKMNWTEAQQYCREHHTDLLSGHDQMDEFRDENKDRFMWIGLFRDTWNWSDGSRISFRNWDVQTYRNNQTNDASIKECAAVSHGSGKWSPADCDAKKPFFCYKDKIVLIKESKTWPEALEYCRAHHYDLVSIADASEQRWVQEKAKKASSPHVWLGLRYTCTLSFWFWVSDMAVRYDNWNSTAKTDDCDMSGAMEKGGQHKWVKKLDTETFNFICSEW